MKTHASLDDSGRSVLVLKSLRRYIREKKIQTLEDERNLESVSRKEDVLADFKANVIEIFKTRNLHAGGKWSIAQPCSVHVFVLEWSFSPRPLGNVKISSQLFIYSRCGTQKRLNAPPPNACCMCIRRVKRRGGPGGSSSSYNTFNLYFRLVWSETMSEFWGSYSDSPQGAWCCNKISSRDNEKCPVRQLKAVPWGTGVRLNQPKIRRESLKLHSDQYPAPSLIFSSVSCMNREQFGRHQDIGRYVVTFVESTFPFLWHTTSR